MAKPNEYTCEACNRTFVYDWTDEEAMAESIALFGPLPKEDIATVCDDCFKAMEIKEKAHNELVRIGADLINSQSNPKVKQMIKDEWAT